MADNLITTLEGILETGIPGKDGTSPKATVTDNGDGTYTLTIIDAEGETSVTWIKGTDGFSPVVTTQQIEGGTEITITDSEGTHTARIMDGAKGEKGDPGQTGPQGPAGEQGAQGPRGFQGPTGEQGPAGEQGPEGPAGATGPAGTPGFSPSATVTQTSSGATITITDRSGTTTATVENGAKGDRGPQGDKGEPGEDGTDGFSPTVATEETTGGAIITITDATGSQTVRIKNGAKGETGDTGPQGPKGEKGDAYVLTAADKAEIEGICEANIKTYVDDNILGGNS